MPSSPRLEKLRAMLAADDGDALLYYMLAMEHASLGDAAAAATAFQTLVRRFPDYVPAYFQYGRTLISLGRDEEARQVLEAGQTAALKAGDLHAAEEIAALRASLAR